MTILKIFPWVTSKLVCQLVGGFGLGLLTLACAARPAQQPVNVATETPIIEHLVARPHATVAPLARSPVEHPTDTTVPVGLDQPESPTPEATLTMASTTVLVDVSPTPVPQLPPAVVTAGACAVTRIEQLPNQQLEAEWRGVAVAATADRSGVYQLMVTKPNSAGPTCISCSTTTGTPPVNLSKVMANVSADGKWVIAAVELAKHPAYGGQGYQKALEVLNGWYMNLWVTSIDGKNWYQLTDYTTGGSLIGVLSPHFSSDGTKVIWSKLVAPPTQGHRWGYYQFYLADFVVGSTGVPTLQNVKNILAGKATWYEPEGFSPDGSKVIFVSNIASSDEGQDIWTYDLASGALTNLTKSPDQWDEHARYSPSGKKVAWMSSLPFAASGPATEGSIRTEEMLMNADGSNVQQLTHFSTPGYPEYNAERSMADVAVWSPDGSQLAVGENLLGKDFPKHLHWLITFAGLCGG